MKRLICILGIVPLLLTAADHKKKPAAKPVAVRQIVIPKDAKQVDASTWRYTDPQGKTWLYIKSPFGVTRSEEGAGGAQAQAQAASAAPQGMKAYAEGDKVRFETVSPFGVSRWVKSKDEMTEFERQVWERDSAAGSKQPAASTGAERKE